MNNQKCNKHTIEKFFFYIYKWMYVLNTQVSALRLITKYYPRIMIKM